MLIALDFDETYTLDPEFWNDFIIRARMRGHSVICCTMRFEREGDEIRKALGDIVEAIVFTGRKAKKEFVEEYGYYPSVWIDDSPYWLLNDG